MYPQTHQLAIFIYSMKRVALPCSQGLTLLGFFSQAILFSQSQINNPDPQMFLFMKKKTLWHFFMDGVHLPQGQYKNHFEEAVFSLLFTIKFSEIAGTHLLSTSEGQKTQIVKSDPRKGVSVISKILFPHQVDEGFWLYYTNV